MLGLGRRYIYIYIYIWSCAFLRLQESCTAFLAVDCNSKNPNNSKNPYGYTLGYDSPESSTWTIYFLTLLATSGTSFMSLFPTTGTSFMSLFPRQALILVPLVPGTALILLPCTQEGRHLWPPVTFYTIG